MLRRLRDRLLGRRVKSVYGKNRYGKRRYGWTIMR